MSAAPIEIVILAAGQGTRMKSSLPKVLHPLAGKPLLGHVLDTARCCGAERIHVVYGHGGDQVRCALDDGAIHWAEQAEQLGTGHAVQQAVGDIADDSMVVILYGDVPLVSPATVARLIDAAETGLGLLTVLLDDPTGYGRIVRDGKGQVLRIVEQKDATEEELAIREGNTGMMAMPARELKAWLQRLGNDNAQGEYYLTDLIEFAVNDGVAVNGLIAADHYEVAGINDRVQLAELERVFQENAAVTLMREGVTIADPARFELRGEVSCGRDVSIDINVILEGKVTLGEGTRIGAGCVLKDVEIGDNVEILPMSVIEEAVIEDGCQLGPFARVRPGTRLSEKVKVGNFVEVKNSSIGAGSKVNHLSYIGDTTMGTDVNIGAGTITCNYDGANKHRTVIGDRVFVGSDTQLVAPVTVEDGATIGAGSTITRDAPAETLTLSRSKQASIKGWKRPSKEQQ